MTTEALAPAREAEAVERVHRFTRTERATHWLQALSFIILLFTGFALMLPQMEAIMGHRELLREIHLSSAFFFFFGPAIVALSGDRRSVAKDVEAVDTWDSDDLHWLALPNSSTPQGRFNAGQKLNAIFIVWSTLTFTVTGFILWQNRRFPGDVVSQANTIHTLLAYVALAAFLGHLYYAVAYPKTRHALNGITRGWVRSDWAREHHGKWIATLTPPLPTPRLDGVRTTLQIVLGAFAAFFASRVLFFALGANVTDRATEHLYDVTAWPGAASIHPQTGVNVFDWIGLVYGLLCLAAWLVVDRLRRLRPAQTS